MALMAVKCGLVAALVATGLFSALADDPVMNAGVLNGDKTELTVTVNTELETFDPALLMDNLATVTKVIKLGEGTLDVPFATDLTSYMGDFEITQGRYRYHNANGLGYSAGKTAGWVRVADGATLEAYADDIYTANQSITDFRLFYKHFELSGSGTDGKGVVVYTHATGKKIYFNGASLGTELILKGDVKIYAAGVYPYWNSGNTMNIDLRGHKLEADCDVGIAIGYPKIIDTVGGGTICCSAGELNIMNFGSSYYVGREGDDITVLGVGKIVRPNSNQGLVLATLDVQKSGTTLAAGANKNLGDATRLIVNRWDGPILLHDYKLNLSITKYDGDCNFLSIYGPISGGGSLSASTSEATLESRLNLLNANNTFTGGINMNSRCELWLHCSGAAPVNGAAITLNDTSLVLAGSDYFELPALTVNGTGCVNRVSTASGHWNGAVTKKGDGKLVLAVPMTGNELKLESGTVKLAGASSPRARLSGLIEGYFDNCTQETAGKYRGSDDYLATNGCVNSVAMSYESGNNSRWVWYEPEAPDVHVKRVWSYSGYIWNNTDSDQTWHFAGCDGTACRLSINGQEVYYITQNEILARDAMGHGSAVLKPGANRFVYKIYCSQSGACPRTLGSSHGNSWPTSNFGLGYKIGGEDETVPQQSNYSKLIDPGDGSLFTWDLPENAYGLAVPGTTHSLPASDSGFEQLSLTSGTTVEFYGVVVDEKPTVAVQQNLKGTGVIAELSEFHLSNTWELDLAEVAAAHKLDLENSAVLTGSKLKLTNAAATKLPYGSYTVLTTGSGLTGCPELDTSAVGGEWTLVNSCDSELVLTRVAPGMVIIIK